MLQACIAGVHGEGVEEVILHHFNRSPSIFLGTRDRGVGSLVRCYGDLGSLTTETLSSSE